jgi:glycosyltransferase involved in cell wall biosynthesis
VTVAYPGVGAATSEPLAEAARREALDRLGLAEPFVLGVGTIEPRKDWPTLIAAFERLARDGSGDATAQSGGADPTLVIAGGDGWMTEKVHAAAEASPADVRLLGFVPDDDLRALYQSATAFAYPSVYEGFGLPPLEAMACGVPTVVSDAPCLPEVVGDAALVVPAGDADALADALRRALAEDGLRRELHDLGKQRAARFTWDACAEAVENAYRGALSL